MKALLEKIRKILRSRRTRQIFTRFVSGVAAVVVFVTTYALVLPAITLEQNASCGIPEHQHTDACYEERLVCETPEGQGHHHDASCYDKILICGQEVHVHSPECYQEDSSAVVSSGSAAAASTAFGAAAEPDVLYGTDGSENDTDALVTDRYAAGEDAGEEGVEETAQTAETDAEKSAAEESASDQAVGESGTDNTAAEGSDSGESDAEEADEKRDTVAGEYDAGEAAPEESAQDGSDSGIADTEGLKDSEDRNSEENKTADTTDSNEAVNGSASDTSNAENEDAVAAGTEEAANEATTNVLPEPVETENLSAGYVPELDSIELDSVLNKHTDFYYFHPEQGQEIPETSAEVTDWKKVKNGLFGSTKLESTDLVKMYLSYTIPAGTLNETNQVVRYRLPSNIHLTDEQIIAINETENGMSALYADAADDASNIGEQAQDENQAEDENAAGYQKYLGAEAIEGIRRPDQNLKEGAQEYISAIVKAENVFDDEGIYGEKGAFLGQDLIFIFTPYSIEKNQITYNADGDPLSAGEKITGWFACDFNMSQIGWVEQDTDLDNSTVEKTAEIVFVEKDSEKNIKEISRTLKLVDGPEDESDAASGETVDEAQTAASDETAAAAETASAADTSASAEAAATADTASEKASEDKAAGAEEKEDAEDGPFKAGTLTADGDGYKITLDYTEKAEIPENAELSVREITAETDKEAYETCLEQAGQQVAADEKTGVDRKASRFFDIEILVRDTDSEGKEETRKIEPSAPVSVNIQIIDDQAAKDSGSKDSKSEDSGSKDQKSSQSEPAVLHFAEEGVEQIDAEVKDSQEQKGDEDKSTGKESEPAGAATEISFEAESFSIYGVVYTVDFEYSVNGKMYQFSLPGGGFVSFTDLVEVLGIIGDTNDGENEAEIDAAEVQDTNGLFDVEASDAAKKFVEDVASVEFSSPELVDVSRVESETTVGQIKDSRKLECEYSAELTEEQIAEINAQTVEAGDWALISLKAFDTEESLTVTMKNGDQWTVKVTDAQEIPNAEATSIDPNKSYLICYEVNGVYYLLKNDGSVDSAYHPDFEGDSDEAHDFEHLNSTYAWSFNHIFKEQDVEHHLDKNYYLIRPIDNKSRTITLNDAGEALVQQGNNNVAVIQSDDGFILEGYHNVGTEDEPRYIHLSFNGTSFTGVDGEGITIHIYEMDSLPTYDYTVRSADEIRGTVTVSDGTEQTVHHEGSTDTHYYEATSTAEKKNGGTITATPVSHMNQGQNKWQFDHWELDGLPLDRAQYGATIQADQLPIPHNGSNLVAYFRQNPNYVVPPSEKEPSSIEDMSGWMAELLNRNIPLDSSATKKTAEVYDYQNRIYRVDFISKANFETFAGNIDMAFCLDVSNSMYFPSALVETTSANRDNPMPIYQINNYYYGNDWWNNYDNRNWLDTSRDWNNPYYLVADASGTATVFRIYYQDGYWKAQDASRDTENNKSFIIGQEDFTTNYGEDARHPFTKGDNDNTTYTIYDAGDDGKNRFVYLNQSLSGSSTDLNTISNLLAVAGDASPGVKIAYNTFNKDLGTNNRSDFQTASPGLTVDLSYSSGGGTRPDQAFNDAQNFSWSADYTVENGVLTATDRYVILVTDGAPQGIRTGESNTTTNAQIETWVREAAQDLKDNSHVKLITVGLSMDNVTSGKQLLYDLADLDSNGNKMFYMAESGSDLQNIFRQITKVLMEDAVVLGNVTDTVGEGFYLVDKRTGLPLKATDTIDIEGNLTTDESKIAGVVQEDGKTIVWTEQPIDSAAGWHGTVYVKAQEELLGGNGMNTNDGEATIVATKYRVGGKDVPFDTTLVRDTLNLTAELPSPKVNVNELTFFNNETEWTVYLGESVDPKEQLKALYESLVVEEVVNEDGSLHYTISPNSIEERWDAADGTAATFSLPGLIETLIRKDSMLEARYYNGSELNWDVFLGDTLSNGITLPYHEYGLTDGSNIKITLEKTIAANEEDDLINHSPHATTVTGDEIEKYVLRIAYEPDYTVTPVGQGGQSADDFHTGTFGTMYQGHAAGRESSTNTHIINVYNVPLDVYKVDGSDNPLSGATFKLYKVDDENGEKMDELDSSHTYVEVAAATSGTDGIARLKHDGEDFGLVLGEKYYLIETAAPANYTKVNTVWEVEVQTEIGKFTDLDAHIIYSMSNPDPAATPPVTVGNGVTADMYPFNWDQGARIMLDGTDPVLVIAKGETEGSTVEITDGSFVSHSKAISFRHTVVNLLGGTIDISVEKSWEGDDEQNRPDSVTVKLYRVSEKDHEWGEGVVVLSTCTDAGNKQYTCSVCGETKTEVITAAGHQQGTSHRENETIPTCTEAGGYDTVVRCTVCNAIISSEHTNIEALGHDWGEWQVTTPAQPGVAGVETRVCNHDASHVETREIPALPNTTAITYMTYRDYWGDGWLENVVTTTDQYPIGSNITFSWSSNSAYYATAYINGTAEFIPNSYKGYELSGTTVDVTRTGSRRPYNYSVTVTVTDGMTVFLKSDEWNNYPTNITITQNRSVNAAASRSLKLSPAKALLSTDSEQLRSGSATTDPVMAYLNTIAEKSDATCSETEGAVHTYKELAGTYTITGDSWTLNIPDLPQYNEYGKPYTYYVVETPVEGYETTYSGQDDGLTGGTVTITNKLKTVELPVSKTWAFATPSRVTKVEGKDWPQDVTVHVVVYSKTGDSEPVPTTFTVDLTADQTSYTFTGLPMYAADGVTEIEYSVVEASVSGVDSTNFTTTISGEATSGYTITNTEKPSTKDFSFTKIWRDPLGNNPFEWPYDKSITVTIKQDSEDYAEYTISNSDLTAGTEISANGEDSDEKAQLIVTSAEPSTGYVFTLTGLPYGDTEDGYSYTVSEETVDGYQSPKYFVGETQQMGASQVGSGGIIYNDQIGYELPSTGGHGTRLFTILGSILILGAGVLLWRRRRLI